MADCIREPALWDRVLPIGGPGEALSALQQGEMLFDVLGQEPRFIRVPVALFDAIIGFLDFLASLFAGMKDTAEFGRIGKYYAVESMLVMDPKTGRYDADATPSYGKDTLRYAARGACLLLAHLPSLPAVLDARAVCAGASLSAWPRTAWRGRSWATPPSSAKSESAAACDGVMNSLSGAVIRTISHRALVAAVPRAHATALFAAPLLGPRSEGVSPHREPCRRARSGCCRRSRRTAPITATQATSLSTSCSCLPSCGAPS